MCKIISLKHVWFDTQKQKSDLSNDWATFLNLHQIYMYICRSVLSIFFKCTSTSLFKGGTFYTLPERGGGYTVLPLSVWPSFRPSKIFFVTFYSVTVDGRNLIFGHKLHIGTPYRGKRFWTHQIPTSCLPILLIFIHI